MANRFEYSPLNPIRLVRVDLPDNDAYFYKPFDLETNTKRCYLQKYSRKDTTRLQFLSDFQFSFEIKKVINPYYSLALTPEVMSSNVVGQTFTVYEVEIDFASLTSDKYYCEVKYLNDNATQVVLQSEPIEVDEDFPATLFIHYLNRVNNYSVIFDTGIAFGLRVEGAIKDFTPASDDEIYIDQQRNATLLSSVPYRLFTAYLGDAGGVPNWMADRLNHAFACDTITLDGVLYQKQDGAKWEVKRTDPDGTEFIGLKINIMPVDNFFFGQYQLGDEAQDGYTVVEKSLVYSDVGGDFSIANVFRRYILLKHITVYRKGISHQLKIGITPNGDEIGAFDVTDQANTFSVDYAFVSSSTLYFTELNTDGIDDEICINLLQYDAKPVTVIPPQPAGGLLKGAAITFDGTPEEISAAFDLTTGLGKVGGGWDAWAVMDGRNGTTDRSGKVVVQLASGDADFGTIGNTGGAKKVALSKAEMPAHNHALQSGLSKRGNTGSNSVYDNFSTDGNGITTYTGGEPNGSPDAVTKAHENMPPYIVTLWVKKIID